LKETTLWREQLSQAENTDRKEARRVPAQELTLGTYLRSQAKAAQLLRSIPMKWDS